MPRVLSAEHNARAVIHNAMIPNHDNALEKRAATLERPIACIILIKPALICLYISSHHILLCVDGMNKGECSHGGVDLSRSRIFKLHEFGLNCDDCRVFVMSSFGSRQSASFAFL